MNNNDKKTIVQIIMQALNINTLGIRSFFIRIMLAVYDKPAFKKLYKNKLVHKCVGHPLYNIFNKLKKPDLALRVHNATLPYRHYD